MNNRGKRKRLKIWGCELKALLILFLIVSLFIVSQVLAHSPFEEEVNIGLESRKVAQFPASQQPKQENDKLSEAFKARFKQAMMAVYNARTREDLEKAAAEFVAARSLSPSNPEVNYNLGLVYLELDEYAKACNFFENYLSLSPAPGDAERARKLYQRAQLLKQRYERALSAMLNPRSWRLLEVKPAELDASWFTPEFRLTPNGQLQVRNPRLNYRPLDKEELTTAFPWLPLTLKGRYFEFIVCLARERACTHDLGFCLIQGEIVFEGARTLVIVRNYLYSPKVGKTFGGAYYIKVYELLL